MGPWANPQRWGVDLCPLAWFPWHPRGTRNLQVRVPLEFFNCELGPGPMAPPLLWGGKYSHESKLVANLLVDLLTIWDSLVIY